MWIFCLCICIWYVFVFVFVFVISRSSVDIKIIAAAALLWCWMEPALRSQIFDIDVAFAFREGGNMFANFICSILQFVCFLFVCLFTHILHIGLCILSVYAGFLIVGWCAYFDPSQPPIVWISYINTMYLFLNIVYQYNVYNLFLVGLEAQNRKGTEGLAWVFQA